MKNAFTEDDKQKFVEFLNFIAQRAVFPDWKTEDTVKHFKLLAHMQQSILPKIEANIFEIVKMIKPKEVESVDSLRTEDQDRRDS